MDMVEFMPRPLSLELERRNNEAKKENGPKEHEERKVGENRK